MYSVSYTTPACWIWNQIYSRQMELVPCSKNRDKYWAPKTKKLGTPSLTNIHLNTFLSLLARKLTHFENVLENPKLAQKWKTVYVMSKWKSSGPAYVERVSYANLDTSCSNLFQSILFLDRYTLCDIDYVSKQGEIPR